MKKREENETVLCVYIWECAYAPEKAHGCINKISPFYVPCIVHSTYSTAVARDIGTSEMSEFDRIASTTHPLTPLEYHISLVISNALNDSLYISVCSSFDREKTLFYQCKSSIRMDFELNSMWIFLIFFLSLFEKMKTQKWMDLIKCSFPFFIHVFSISNIFLFN